MPAIAAVKLGTRPRLPTLLPLNTTYTCSSSGEKCELAAALLYRPDVLFLDEPTLGLDVTMQSRIRRFVGDSTRRGGATVLLTSHYMADVTALCRRVIVIDRGSLLYDGPLDSLAERIAPFKLIRVDVEGAGFFGMGRFPVDAYPLWLRRVLTFVVPVALVTTVPAEALTGHLATLVPLVSVLTATLMVWLSTRLWRLGLGQYTSASS